MNEKERELLIEEYPLLNKPCYTENLNKGQNWKEFLAIENSIWTLCVIGLNVLFVLMHN